MKFFPTRRTALGAPLALGLVGIALGGPAPDSQPATHNATQQALKQYCGSCHGKAAMAGINVDQLTTSPMADANFGQWKKIAAVLEEHRMPPAKMPQPSDAVRNEAALWIRASLKSYAERRAGDPGSVTVRRLTSAEYGYTVHDLTGLDLDFNSDFAGDAVGGEGFSSFGDVQFVSDANLERYIESAKRIADHAIVGSGPIEWYENTGKTGFELSAINRIKDIYTQYGFRTVSGEGGSPFGLDKYTKVFFACWEYQNRAKLGKPNATLAEFAAKEGVTARFAQHIWTALHQANLGYPSSEVAARWRKLAAPSGDGKEAAVQAQCEGIQKFVTTWPSWLFARGDLAAGGAGDESPLIINDKTLKGETSHRFNFVMGRRQAGELRSDVGGGAPIKVFLKVDAIDPNVSEKPVIIWRNATVGTRVAVAKPSTADAAKDKTTAAAAKAGELKNVRPLREVLSPEWVAKLNFGHSPDGSEMGPNDFATVGEGRLEIPNPGSGGGIPVLQVVAEIGTNRDTMVRIVFSNREDGKIQGIPTRAILGDEKSKGYAAFKAGVFQLMSLWPPNAYVEPTPADKDPPPAPFDPTFNTPEHDEWVARIKYIRDDRYIYYHILDDATRAKLDHAWNDLHASFEYYDNYLDMLSKKFKLDLKMKHMSELNEAQLQALPPEPRKYLAPVRAEYEVVQRAQRAARPGHVEDCVRFASLAWRRPLSEAEKESLRQFYAKARTGPEMDHTKAIQALLARILVAPSFLYRVERPSEAVARPLSSWEVANRLSYFLWSSMPDTELRRAAASGDLTDKAAVERQVKRMMADPKARRFAAEFFGQWLGFYRFDQFKGVDTARFPEFTQEVKASMYDEAVSFFEYMVRNEKPVKDILSADYTFVNKPLAKYYGLPAKEKAGSDLELLEGANIYHRGGVLRMGAVLTATSAPLRTSPVKRGDWVLRRILGTPTPPPPPDAGSIPADDHAFAGMTLREKMESHKRNATCASCHTRIDPLGFPLEHFDSTGRWRDKYGDGKAVDDQSVAKDGTEIIGVDGLQKYLQTQQPQVLYTLNRKLVGYALGRTVLPSDEPLIEHMMSQGNKATMESLVSEIATSKQFRYRREPDASPTPPVIAKKPGAQVNQETKKSTSAGAL